MLVRPKVSRRGEAVRTGNTLSRVTCSPDFIAACTAASPVYLDFSVTALAHASPKEPSLGPQVLLQETAGLCGE